MKSIAVFVLAAVFACALTVARAEDKKGGSPVITAVAPLEVIPGTTATLRVRGLNLDRVSEVRFVGAGSGIKVEIKEKKKADIPNGLEAKDVGDTQLEANVTMPADLPLGSVRFILAGSEGNAAARDLRVTDAESLTEEKEPNNGFNEAQPIEAGKTIRGAVNQDKDVDVFRFEGHAGQKIHAEVRAFRLGSLLDGILTLFDARGQVLAACDDTPDSRDPVLDATLLRDEVCYFVIQDAQDRGGPWHCYEFTITVLPK